MQDRRRVLAIVQAGGQGGRMDVLTREKAKPALAFGGCYQLIDFAMSSLYHAGIADVWVTVQYLAGSLDRHLAGGRPWDLDRTIGGYRRVVPEQGSGGDAKAGFSQGNADNLARIADDIADSGAELVVVLSADHVFALDLRDVIDFHTDRDAEATLVTADVTRNQARANAVVLTDRRGRVTDFAYKPAKPKATTVATEIFVYDAAALAGCLDRIRRELAHTVADDADDGNALGDFGEHLVPDMVARGKVFGFPIGGYWRDLGRPEEYLTAHRDLLAGRVDAIKDPDRPILSRFPERPPAMLHSGSVASNSIVNPGCVLRGEVINTVLAPGVTIETGARVEGSVLGEDVVVRAGARVHTAVLDSRVRVGRNAVVGAVPAAPRAYDKDIVLIGQDSWLAAGARIPAGARLEPGTQA